LTSPQDELSAVARAVATGQSWLSSKPNCRPGVLTSDPGDLTRLAAEADIHLDLASV
jgi:hypothetical protein